MFEEGEFDTYILPESQRYDLTDKEVDAVIEDIKLVNRSDSILHFWSFWSTATLQEWDGTEWEDRGAWYYVLAIGPRAETLAPGDTLRTMKLDLRSVAHNMNIMDSSGYYRIHFEVYRDERFEELIPEVDRASEPFKVILG